MSKTWVVAYGTLRRAVAGNTAATSGPSWLASLLGAPTNLQAVQSQASVVLTWGVPTSLGGATIGSWRVSDGATSRVVAVGTREAIFTDRVVGTSYDFSVSAIPTSGSEGAAATVTLTVQPFTVTDPGGGGGSGRVAHLHPFETNSLWNLPIGVAATYESSSDPQTAKFLTTVGGSGMNYDQFSHPVNYASASDPLVTTTDTNESKRSATFRTPVGARVALPVIDGPQYTDGHMHVINPERTQTNETFRYRRDTTTTARTERHQTCSLLGSGMGPQAGTRAYGGSAIGGLIRAWEVDSTHPSYTGEIKHALAIAIKNDMLYFDGALWNAQGQGYGYFPDGDTTPLNRPSSGWPSNTPRGGHMKQTGYVWPATEQDWDSPQGQFGNGQYTGNIPMGSYFAIPWSVDVEALAITPQAKMVARALQRYGGYITDRSGAAFQLYLEDNPSTVVRDWWRAAAGYNGGAWNGQDLVIIRSQLRRVTNNLPATPNGTTLGGARRAALAAALG